MKGDFDPEQYDKQMAAAFGDDYYGVCVASIQVLCQKQSFDFIAKL